MAYMTINQVFDLISDQGFCDEGICDEGREWTTDNNIINIKEAMDNCQRAGWLFWTFILLEYDMDNTMALVVNVMPQSDRVDKYMVSILAETNLEHKANMAWEIFKNGGQSHCDIIRANTTVLQ